MQHIIYADIAFLLNFCMDFLALFAAGRALNIKISALRLVLSSVFGAFYGIATLFFSYSVLPDIVLNIAVSVAMCFIAYKISSLAMFTKIFLVFYLACFMLGGGIEALYYMSGVISENFSETSGEINLSAGKILVLAVVCVVVFIFATKITRRNAKEKKVTSIIGFDGKECSVVLLVDSGNMLTDPISSLPVIIVNINHVAGLFHIKALDILLNKTLAGEAMDIETAKQLRFRIIPTKTLNESSILPAFIPDYIKIQSPKKRHHNINAVVAVDVNTKNTYGLDCGGIIPQASIENS